MSKLLPGPGPIYLYFHLPLLLPNKATLLTYPKRPLYASGCPWPGTRLPAHSNAANSQLLFIQSSAGASPPRPTVREMKHVPPMKFFTSETDGVHFHTCGVPKFSAARAQQRPLSMTLTLTIPSLALLPGRWGLEDTAPVLGSNS